MVNYIVLNDKGMGHWLSREIHRSLSKGMNYIFEREQEQLIGSIFSEYNNTK